MTEQSAERKNRWTPPPRPDWVARINEEGTYMDIGSVVPLDAESLLQAAKRATGLSDFGSDEWCEPFHVLVKSLDEEAELNLLGRIRARSDILIHLNARLQIEETYKRNPEINHEVISQPFIIVGQGRSGTSFLLNVLMSDPDNGVVKTWEGMFPCPPPEKATYLTDPRIERGHKLIDMMNRVTPSIAAMHEFAGDLPLECLQLFGLSFTSAAWFNSIGQVPSYTSYIANVDPEAAYRYHQRVLKLLQWKNPRKHWVLKSPTHLDQLTTALKVYPDACFIWTHRDPVSALASVVSLVGTVQWGRSDHPFKHGSWDLFVDSGAAARRLDSVIDLLESGAVPDAQVFNMLYSDLVGDTMNTMSRMYAHFGIPLTSAGREGMQRYLTENPRTARAPHQFDRGSPERIAGDRKAFKRYQEYFNVPNEI